MVVHKVTSILDKTSHLISYPPEVVASVIQHSFSQLKSHLNDPQKALFRSTYLGSVHINHKALLNQLRRLISSLRKKDSKYDQYLAEFRILWPLRHKTKK